MPPLTSKAVCATWAIWSLPAPRPRNLRMSLHRPDPIGVPQHQETGPDRRPPTGPRLVGRQSMHPHRPCPSPPRVTASYARTTRPGPMSGTPVSTGLCGAAPTAQPHISLNRTPANWSAEPTTGTCAHTCALALPIPVPHRNVLHARRVDVPPNAGLTRCGLTGCPPASALTRSLGAHGHHVGGADRRRRVSWRANGGPTGRHGKRDAVSIPRISPGSPAPASSTLLCPKPAAGCGAAWPTPPDRSAPCSGRSPRLTRRWRWSLRCTRQSSGSGSPVRTRSGRHGPSSSTRSSPPPRLAPSGGRSRRSRAAVATSCAPGRWRSPAVRRTATSLAPPTVSAGTSTSAAGPASRRT